jgi:SAM-dependent methyltransferase
MYEFHKDKQAYFKQQTENAASYVIPFVKPHMNIRPGTHVLEVGCAEGGVLKAFLDAGCTGVGVELSPSRAEMAKDFLSNEIASGKAEIIGANIYDQSFQTRFHGKFDLIVLKDVIEHIHDQQRVIIALKEYLKPSGKIFFGFPPWQMPFGGHQQVCRNKWLAKLPYYHLLPLPLYRWLLRVGGESESLIIELEEVKETGLSIEQFERYVKKAGMKIFARTFYLVNPIYRYKFGLKPRKQNALVATLPYVRNYFTTCMYYVVG